MTRHVLAFSPSTEVHRRCALHCSRPMNRRDCCCAGRSSASDSKARAGRSTDRTGRRKDEAIAAANHAAAAAYLMTWLDSEPAFSAVSAVAHRVVHGMAHSTPERVTRELLGDLRRIMAFDPEHLPFEIDLIAAIGATASGAASGGVFRHGVPSHHAAGRATPAHSAALSIDWHRALWFPRPLVRISHAGACAPRRSGCQARARDPGASRQRREPRPQCATGAASIPAWVSRPLPEP